LSIEQNPYGLFVVRQRPLLVVPASYRPPQRVAADWHVLLLWSEVNPGFTPNRDTLLAALLNRLSLLGRFRGLRLITAINCLALTHGQERADVQIGLARDFGKALPIKLHDTVIRMVSEGRILFGAEQLAILASFVVQHGVTDEPRPDDATSAFVEACLIVNELFGVEQIALKDAAYSELEPKLAPDRRAAMLEAFLPMEIRSAALDTEPTDGLLWRMTSFVEWARAKNPTDRDYCDINGALRDIFGLDYEELISAGLLVQAYFNSLKTVQDVLERNPIMSSDLLISPLSDNRAQRYLDAVSMPLDDLIRELAGRDGMSAAALVPVQRRPLIEVAPHQYACPIPAFLGCGLGIGLYHRLAEYFGAKGRRSRFHHFFAAFLQKYAENTTRTALDKTGAPVVGEFKYYKGKQHFDSSDYFVIEGRRIIFFDVCNKRLNTETSLNEARLDSMHSDIDDMIIEQAKQLHGRIQDFKDGKYTIAGLGADKFDDIVPVAVTHQALHGWAATRAYIDRRLRERGYLQQGPRLEVIALSEIETLVQAFDGELSLSELFERRRTHSDEVARGRSLNNYLLLHGEWDGRNRRRIPGLDEWLKETVEAQLIAWGLNPEVVENSE